MASIEWMLRRDYSKENHTSLVSSHYFDVTLYTETNTIMVSSLFLFAKLNLDGLSHF